MALTRLLAPRRERFPRRRLLYTRERHVSGFLCKAGGFRQNDDDVWAYGRRIPLTQIILTLDDPFIIRKDERACVRVRLLTRLPIRMDSRAPRKRKTYRGGVFSRAFALCTRPVIFVVVFSLSLSQISVHGTFIFRFLEKI